MSKNWFSNFILAGIIRLLLMNSEYQRIISDRVEVSTALNSWKRVTEGVYLHNFGIDPYTGDLFHETPIGLFVFHLMQQHLSRIILLLLFIITDLTTALLLGLTAKHYAKELALKKQAMKADNIKKCGDSAASVITSAFIYKLPVFHCINFDDKAFYILELHINSPADFAGTLSCVANEMFEHFRWLFIASFQINVSLLYIVPLALRLRQDPMLLAFSYLAITAIFKSYPCIGDVGFYMSLLPLWKHLFEHMQQGFIVGCFMLFCTIFAPIVWHQWIYTRSANANFYFGVTLAFAIAQIFLLTDILFASVKHEFANHHGMNKEIGGNKVKLLLE
ncbi:hypothetical protein KM043_018275 [Ampulex compressa]|nr:hypothetical protein KM043_018275 [Ampulex compressa]